MPHKALTGEIKAYYIMGEDPLQTEADLGRCAKASRRWTSWSCRTSS
nr:Formate dehydrogenase H [Klebsiella pneumoniae]